MAEGNGTGKPAPPAPSPTIRLVFTGVNLAECRIEHDPAVTDGQLFLAAQLLDMYAREVRASILANQARQQLVAVRGVAGDILGGRPHG